MFAWAGVRLNHVRSINISSQWVIFVDLESQLLSRLKNWWNQSHYLLKRRDADWLTPPHVIWLFRVSVKWDKRNSELDRHVLNISSLPFPSSALYLNLLSRLDEKQSLDCLLDKWTSDALLSATTRKEESDVMLFSVIIVSECTSDVTLWSVCGVMYSKCTGPLY